MNAILITPPTLQKLYAETEEIASPQCDIDMNAQTAWRWVGGMRNKKTRDKTFKIIKLDLKRDRSWAVIGLPSGSIALELNENLIMRLHKEAAQAIADRLNQQVSTELNQMRHAVGLADNRASCS